MTIRLALALLSSFGVWGANAANAKDKEKVSPIEKVIEMIGDLQQKIIKEGEAAQKTYDEFAEWCEDEAKNLQFEIKTAKAEAEDLNAVIEKANSDISIQEEEISKNSGTISADQSDLKAATAIRTKEHGIFAAEEAELTDTVETLDKAIAILEREMAKGASMLQLKSAASVADALKTLLAANGMEHDDATKLQALLQSQEDDGDDSTQSAAPDSKAGGIVEILNDMLEKAEDQLAEARKTENKNKFEYDQLKAELEGAIKFAQKELDKAKKKKAAAEEVKATAQGELDVVMKGLGEDMTQLNNIHHDCMTKAENFETETKARNEEIGVLTKAKKIIIEATGGAMVQTYSSEDDEDSPEFLQLTMTTRTQSEEAKFQAVQFIHGLARKIHSSVLMQLADRIAAASTFASNSGEDPFAKVKGLITDMIEKLMKEAEAEAAQKGYCDKEMGETETKKAELEDEIGALATKIEEGTAQAGKLKEEVAILSKELSDLAKSQAEMDAVRKEENDEFKANKKEMDEGLEGIRLALKVLREYYAKGGALLQTQGDAGGIIALLEVIESDFEKDLAEIVSAEEEAASEYKKATEENQLLKTTKEQDTKYKTKEAKGLDTKVAEATEDKNGLQSELDSVLEYYDKIKEECIAKVPSYEEIKKRRDQEIAGLKEALGILEGTAVLLQKSSTRMKAVFRGGRIQA